VALLAAEVASIGELPHIGCAGRFGVEPVGLVAGGDGQR
jgi:hypothetical protein